MFLDAVSLLFGLGPILPTGPGPANAFRMKTSKQIALLSASAVIFTACSKPVDSSEQAGTELAAPANLVLHAAGDNSLTIQWSAVEGASSYDWQITSDEADAKSGSVSQRHVTVGDLIPGTVYGFSVQAVNAKRRSGWSAVLKVSTTGAKPVQGTYCIDTPLVVDVGSGASLGTSGLIQVFKADGTLVDKIDLTDLAKVDVLEDGTMIPKGADADNQQIAIGNDYVFHTFMDALHSSQFRPVHYTPLRLEGEKLYIKLHNEALDFGQSYYFTMDATVAGKAVDKGEMPFTTKVKPSGTTLQVNSDGSGDFCTVQGALSFATSLGKDTDVTIVIADGTYRELLFLRGKNNVTLKGESRDGVRIAYPNNDSYETGSGASVASKPSVGNPIGKSGGRCLFLIETCNNVTLQNLTIENTYSIPSHKGQAETIYFNGENERLKIENSSLISWQDTFLCKGEVYVYGSLIAGHCDYIWGYPQACLFEDCEIRSRAAGYIVQARCPSGSKGFVFLNCKLTGESGVKDGSMYLARSGGSADYFDNVTYVNCTMSQVIAPAGWHTGKAPNPSKPTAAQGWKEYGTKGVSTSSRNSYGRILTVAEAEAYSSKSAVLGW